MQAMLLAAGFGTRLKPYTQLRPKPLFPVLNTPLIHILLDKLVAAGCDRIVVNGHHLAKQVEAAVSGRDEVIFQYEPEILGTGGSLRCALSSLRDEPLLVMNGDIYHDVNLPHLYKAHLKSGDFVTMAMHDYSRFNTVAVQGERVRSFTPDRCSEKIDVRLAFTGIHVLTPEVVEQIPEHGFFHIIELYKKLAAWQEVGCLRVDGAFWRDIGTPGDYLDLHRQLLTKEQASGGWIVSEQAIVAPDVVLKDWGVIGPGARVGKGSSLARCVVWPDAFLPPGSEYVDTIVTGGQSV